MLNLLNVSPVLSQNMIIVRPYIFSKTNKTGFTVDSYVKSFFLNQCQSNCFTEHLVNIPVFFAFYVK